MSNEAENTNQDVQAETTTTKTADATQKRSYESLETHLDDQIAKNVAYRKRESEYKARIAELEPFQEKATTLEEARSKDTQTHRTELAMSRLENLAVRDGIVDPDALKLVDPAELKFDEHGKPTNLSEVLDSFKAAKPHFFTSAPAASVSTSSTAKPPSSPSSTGPKKFSDMSKDEQVEARKKYGF